MSFWSGPPRTPPLETHFFEVLREVGGGWGGGSKIEPPLFWSKIMNLLVEVATLPLAPSHLPRNRGADQLLRGVRLRPKQRRDTGGPLSCLVAHIQAAQGPLRDVLRWLERPAQGAGALPRKVQQPWVALRRRLDRLRAPGPEYAGLELDG